MTSEYVKLRDWVTTHLEYQDKKILSIAVDHADLLRELLNRVKFLEEKQKK